MCAFSCYPSHTDPQEKTSRSNRSRKHCTAAGSSPPRVFTHTKSLFCVSVSYCVLQPINLLKDVFNNLLQLICELTHGSAQSLKQRAENSAGRDWVCVDLYFICDLKLIFCPLSSTSIILLKPCRHRNTEYRTICAENLFYFGVHLRCHVEIQHLTSAMFCFKNRRWWKGGDKLMAERLKNIRTSQVFTMSP